MKEFELRYFNERKGRFSTRHFTSFKEAFEHACSLNLSEFDIDSIRYYNI